MAGTDISSRTPPTRVFERYVFTRLVDRSAGLTNLPDSRFLQVVGPGTATKLDQFVGAGAPGTDNALSTVMPVGFAFQLDGVTYHSWCASTNGWMVLVDPATGTFSESEVISGSSDVNSNIRPSFTSDAVLLAPWFDDLRNRLNEPEQLLASPFSYSSTKVNRLRYGLEPASPYVSPTSFGISYCVDERSSTGRRLVVRWSSISDRGPHGSIVKFEVVICENGTIEYRYAPRGHLIITGSVSGSTIHEGASIGVFMPNGTHRWRDFSVGLGYRVDARAESTYGGFTYDAGYVDSVVTGSTTLTSSYTIGLVPFRNWPATRDTGCTYTFSPPKLGRRVLPRRLIAERDSRQTYPSVARTGDSRSGMTSVAFDDRCTPSYGTSGSSPSTVVSYPTTLTRFFGGSGPGVLERQDLFSGDITATGSTVASVIDQYVFDRRVDSIDAFNELARHEQGASSQFFLTGTSNDHAPDGFGQSLKSKTHVRFSLPVVSPVTMPGNTSSIYYYNSTNDSWEIPQNSTYLIASGASAPPSPNPFAGGDIVTALSGVGAIFEDARGFNAVGSPVSSGTVAMTEEIQSDPNIGSAYTFNDTARFLGKEYAKSVRNNREYRATPDETFSVPITAPFLVEKAVFDVPLSAGRGWFEDMTQCFIPIERKEKFNFGGPALTIALFRQVKLGKGPDAPTQLDLILTGTVTHVYDNTASVVLTNFPPVSNDFQIRPVGFLAYAGSPGGVIDDHGSMNFTGSARVETTAMNTAGLSIAYVRTFLSSNNADSAAAARQLLTQPDLVLKTDVSFPTTSVQVAFMSPFGRAGLGLRPSGRSIMGNEHVTWQGMTDQVATVVKSPFYVGSQGPNAQQEAALALPVFTASAAAVMQLGSHFPAPYLLMPDDRLVLSVSKVRPAVLDGPTTFSGSLPHDMCLIAGDIDVTLYGSHVREGKEFHDALNPTLASNAAHEVIGACPVLDQFDVPYPHERSGSFYDNGVFGTLSTITVLSSQRFGAAPGSDDSYVLLTKVRSRKVSWVNAREYSQLGTSEEDLFITPSKAFRAEQWWEMAPDVRLAQFTDSSERYWDSMMPSVSDCFSADGCGAFVTPNGTFGNAYQIDTGPSGSSGFNPRSTKMGWIWMDYGIPSLLEGDYGSLINTNWNKAFPFEPRYRNASRQVNVERSLVANKMYGGSPTVQAIAPVRVNGFAFGTATRGTAIFTSTPIPNSVCWDWLVDVDLSSTNTFGYYVTGSSGPDDTARGLFGFGDRNTCFLYNGTLLGTNHAVGTRDVEGPHPDGVGIDYDNNFFHISPSIRGWKYGVHSGIPTYSKAYWRPNRFGQFRDMLEQRPFAKFYRKIDRGTPSRSGAGVQPGVVSVTFIEPSSGRRTSAESTWSSNLSTECTSSVPFHDGLSLNRPTINPRVLNLNPNVVRHDARGNIHIA